MVMTSVADGFSSKGARGLKIGVTGVTRVTWLVNLLIFMLFIVVTPLRALAR